MDLPQPKPPQDVQERLRTFLENDPLYRPTNIPFGFASSVEYPERVTLWCQVDGGERPFRYQSPYYQGGQQRLVEGFEQLEYKCGECDDFTAWFHLRGFTRDDDPGVAYIEKIGQYPSFDIEAPRNMRKFLGESEPLYKNGLINLSVGFGIGALAYMRRVVEDKARDILLLLATLQEAEGAPADDVKEMQQLAKGRKVDSILKRAAELLPESLRPGGENPLDRIYDIASGKIHGGTEDEAVDKAMAIRVALEYVVPKLQQQIEGKQAYLDAMSKLDEGS